MSTCVEFVTNYYSKLECTRLLVLLKPVLVGFRSLLPVHMINHSLPFCIILELTSFDLSGCRIIELPTWRWLLLQLLLLLV